MKKILILLLTLSFFTVSINIAKTNSCSLNTKTAVKSANNSSVYYITDKCTKRSFRNSDKFFSYFDSWEEVDIVGENTLRQIPKDELGFMPWGPKKEFKQGTLVKTVEDPKVYLLQKNQKCWLKSEKVFNALNYKFNWISDVHPSFLDKYPTCSSSIDYTDHHPPGTLIKYPDSSDVYILKKQNDQLTKKLIESEEEFEQLDYRWDRILTIDKEETYPDFDEQTIENLADDSDEPKQIDNNNSNENKTYQGDGEYTLEIGDKVVADNNVGIKINSIKKLNQDQQDNFNDNSFWITLDYYLNDKKLTVTPVRYIGSLQVENSNKDYGLDIGYEYKNEQEVQIKINSLTGSISSCQNLVNLCTQKDKDRSICEKKYCAAGKLNDEEKISQNNITVFAPESLSDIAGKVATEASQCYQEVSDNLQISPLAQDVSIRMKYGKGAALTSNYGISWPINKDRLNKIREEWGSYSSDKCENNLLAHELVHFFTLEVSADDIFHEGIANYSADQVVSQEMSTTCLEDSWQGNTPENHVSTVQSRCFDRCMSDCSSSDIVKVKENDTYSLNDKQIKVTDIQPEEFFEGTNNTGAFHGSVDFEIYQNQKKIDSGQLYIGDMKNSGDISFMPKTILVQKIIYPNRTEKEYYVRLKIFENKTGQCSSTCNNRCDRRVDGNKMEYIDLDRYKELPWIQTYQMFYNTSQCLFQKADKANPGSFQEVIREADQAREEAGELCIGESIKNSTNDSTYKELQNTFDIGKECRYQYPLLGNVDCWNQSCIQNIGIK